jgi:hypothetical protein
MARRVFSHNVASSVHLLCHFGSLPTNRFQRKESISCNGTSAYLGDIFTYLELHSWPASSVSSYHHVPALDSWLSGGWMGNLLILVTGKMPLFLWSHHAYSYAPIHVGRIFCGLMNTDSYFSLWYGKEGVLHMLLESCALHSASCILRKLLITHTTKSIPSRIFNHLRTPHRRISRPGPLWMMMLMYSGNKATCSIFTGLNRCSRLCVEIAFLVRIMYESQAPQTSHKVGRRTVDFHVWSKLSNAEMGNLLILLSLEDAPFVDPTIALSRAWAYLRNENICGLS